MKALHHPLVRTQAWLSGAVAIAAAVMLNDPVPVFIGALAGLAIVVVWAVVRG